MNSPTVTIGGAGLPKGTIVRVTGVLALDTDHDDKGKMYMCPICGAHYEAQPGKAEPKLISV